MTLEIAQATFYNIPVGFTKSIIHTVELVAEGKLNIRYSNGNPSIDEYCLTSQTIDEDWDTVNIYLSYYIDDTMTYSFQIFLKKFVEDMIEKYNLIENCWSIEIND